MKKYKGLSSFSLLALLFLFTSTAFAVDGMPPVYFEDKTIGAFTDEAGDLPYTGSYTEFFVPMDGDYFATLKDGSMSDTTGLLTMFEEINFTVDFNTNYGPGTHTITLGRGMHEVLVEGWIVGDPESYVMANYQFNISPVPEMEVWLMMLCGAVFIFYTLRRQPKTGILFQSA